MHEKEQLCEERKNCGKAFYSLNKEKIKKSDGKTKEHKQMLK